MEKIELTECRTNDQTKTEGEGKFEGEIDRFAVPLLYCETLNFLADMTLHTGRKLQRLLSIALTLVLGTWFSYAIVTLSVINKNSILSILSFCPLEVKQFFNFLIPQYLPYLIVLFFCLSLGRALESHIVAVRYFSKIDFFVLTFMRIFLLAGSIGELCGWIFRTLYTLRWRRFTLRIIPFIKTMNVCSIIEKSVRNIEGSPCKLFQRTFKVVNEKDIENIKRIIMDEKELPFLMRYTIKRARGFKRSDVLDIIKTMHPVFYLCMIDNKCGVIADVRYIFSEKAYFACFTFDNKYLKEEFESIMNKEIEKQRELK